MLPRWSKCILLPTTRNASLDRSTDSVARSSLTDEFARWTPADSLPRHTTPQLAFAPAFLRLSLSRPDRPFSAPCCPQHLRTLYGRQARGERAAIRHSLLLDPLTNPPADLKVRMCGEYLKQMARRHAAALEEFEENTRRAARPQTRRATKVRAEWN